MAHETDIENSGLFHECYVVETDGKIESRYGVYIEVLKAGMELNQRFLLSLVKVHEADKVSVSS